MVNVITELEQRNKQLLEETNNINKKREQEIEELKLKIWHVIGMYAPITMGMGTRWYKKLNNEGPPLQSPPL